MDTPNRKNAGTMPYEQPERESTTRFRAGAWERSVASSFLGCRQLQSLALRQLETICGAAFDLLQRVVSETPEADRIATMLPLVLNSCDQLSFDTVPEALAYLCLHLADRYGRVTQVLEQLLRLGHLPLRKNRLTVLDVGAGPAPGLYAAADFYESLVDWSSQHEPQARIGRLTDPHVLDRGQAWDQMLHLFSEYLLRRRHDAGMRQAGVQDSLLPLRRKHANLRGFSVRRAHHAERGRVARQLEYDAEQSDDYLSPGEAMRWAYELPPSVPSAYDIITMCYFLTNPDMTVELETELRELANSLTPGGVLLLLGATHVQYPGTYERVCSIFNSCPVVRISGFEDALGANSDMNRRKRIAIQVRDSVNYVRRLCSDTIWRSVPNDLPSDLLHDDQQFHLPEFRVLAFKHEARPRV